MGFHSLKEHLHGDLDEISLLDLKKQEDIFPVQMLFSFPQKSIFANLFHVIYFMYISELKLGFLFTFVLEFTFWVFTSHKHISLGYPYPQTVPL